MQPLKNFYSSIIAMHLISVDGRSTSTILRGEALKFSDGDIGHVLVEAVVDVLQNPKTTSRTLLLLK